MRAHGLMPGSRLELFEGAGHFPHLDDPVRFVSLLSEFVAGTEPQEYCTGHDSWDGDDPQP